MNWQNIIGNLAFLLIAISFSVKEIIYLRLLSILASACSLIFNFFIASHPLWVPITWNCIFMSLNFYHLFKIFYEKSKIKFTTKELELKKIVFSDLNDAEYFKLMSAASWNKFSPQKNIVTEKQAVQSLFLIYSGEVKIGTSNQAQLAILKDGQFVGEMSFMSGELATATATTTRISEIVSWNQKELTILLERNPSLAISLQKKLGTQISKALQVANWQYKMAE